MSRVRVFEDSESATVSCKGCGAPMRWFETVAGRRMPINGNAVRVETERNHEQGRAVIQFDTADTHWATCTARNRFRMKP